MIGNLVGMILQAGGCLLGLIMLLVAGGLWWFLIEFMIDVF